MSGDSLRTFDVLLGGTLTRAVGVEDLRAAIAAMPCCSRDGKAGRHDPGCWAGCKSAITRMLTDAALAPEQPE